MNKQHQYHTLTYGDLPFHYCGSTLWNRFPTGWRIPKILVYLSNSLQGDVVENNVSLLMSFCCGWKHMLVTVVGCSWNPEPKKTETTAVCTRLLAVNWKNIQPYQVLHNKCKYNKCVSNEFQYHFQNNFYKNSCYSSVPVNTNNEIQWRTKMLTQLQIMASCWEATNPLPKCMNIVIFI